MLSKFTGWYKVDRQCMRCFLLRSGCVDGFVQKGKKGRGGYHFIRSHVCIPTVLYIGLSLAKRIKEFIQFQDPDAIPFQAFRRYIDL